MGNCSSLNVRHSDAANSISIQTLYEKSRESQESVRITNLVSERVAYGRIFRYHLVLYGKYYYRTKFSSAAVYTGARCAVRTRHDIFLPTHIHDSHAARRSFDSGAKPTKYHFRSPKGKACFDQKMLSKVSLQQLYPGRKASPEFSETDCCNSHTASQASACEGWRVNYTPRANIAL
jgi:hypothetical protein